MQHVGAIVMAVVIGLGGTAAHAQPKAGRTAALVAKLADPREGERALTELEQLGDPAAIDGIAAAWEKLGRPPRYLAVIAALAPALTPAQAKAKYFVDFETSGRPASWDHAVPALARAVTTFDPANPRDVEGATLAATALGDANVAIAVAPLAKVVARAPDRRAITVAVEALRGLGKLTVARTEAGAALRGVLALDVPAKRDPANADAGQHFALVGGALNAAGALGDPALTSAVVVAMYRNPELMLMARRALVAFGARAVDALRDVLHGKQVDVERAFAKYHLDKSCDANGAHCKPTSAKEFYAAIVLGDLHDARSTGDLIAILGHPALPAYYADGDGGPVTSHAAAIDALRKLGATGGGPTAAKALAAIWRATNRPPEDRAAAIAAYPFVIDASDPKGQAAVAAELAKLALDNTASEELRQAAAIAGPQLSADHATAKAYGDLARRYFDASAKKQAEADKTAPSAAAADAELAAAKTKVDAAKTKALAAARDPKASVADIRAATDEANVASDAYKTAKRAHSDKTVPHRQAEADARTYIGYARLFQAQIGAIDVAVRCGADARCYADTLARDLDRMTADVSGDIPDLAKWTADEKASLRAATIERALLELARRGPGTFADAVLAKLVDPDRIVRQAVLLALPQVAARPCAACADKLAAAARTAAGRPELADLVGEATILRVYFAPPQP